MSRKFTSTVAGASLLLAILGLLSRGIGFIREIVFASYFGLGRNYDIYLVGAVLPVTIDTIIFYLGQNFFIPSFHNFSSTSQEHKDKFLRFNFWFFSAFGILVAGIMYLFSNQIVSLYLGDTSAEDIIKATGVFQIFLITIPFTTSVSILSALLHSKFNFVSPGISRLFLNVSIIVLVFLFTDVLDIYIIPIGYVTGTILQFIYLLTKTDLKLFGESFSKGALNSILKSSFVVTILVESISQLYIISDRYFILSVDSGGIAALNYAQTLYLLPISIVTLALSTAVLPKLSKSFASGSFTELEQTYNDGMKINLFIFVPLTFIFCFYGDDIIRILYQRGNFDSAGTVITFNTLRYLALSFVFYSTYSISNKLMYSANLTRALLYITLAGIFIKIIFNFLLVGLLKQDGLAASTSLSYLFFFISSILIIKSKGLTKKIIFSQELMFHLTNGIFSLLVVKVLTSLLWSNDHFTDYVGVILFCSIYFLNQFMIRTRSVNLVIGMFSSLLGRNKKVIS